MKRFVLAWLSILSLAALLTGQDVMVYVRRAAPPGGGGPIACETTAVTIVTTSANNIDAPVPSGLTTGDVWVVCIAAEITSGSGDVINIPSGWTGISTGSEGSPFNYPSARCFSKVAGASESAQNVTYNTSSPNGAAFSVRLSGGASLDTASTIASLDAPDITVAANDSVVLIFLGTNGGDDSITEPSGTTKLAEHLNATNASAITCDPHAAGAFAPGAWVVNWSSDGDSTVTFAFGP